jgi:hypothetical protein
MQVHKNNTFLPIFVLCDLHSQKNLFESHLKLLRLIKNAANFLIIEKIHQLERSKRG